MNTQDSQSELDEIFKKSWILERSGEKIPEWHDCNLQLRIVYYDGKTESVMYTASYDLIKKSIEAYVTTRVKEAERLARLDEQKRTDGAYKRFHVKESAEGDYIGAETDWISGEKRIEQLEALTTTTNGKEE